MSPAVVIPVRTGDRNEELRYTLRALDAHIPHDDVVIVGYCPPWVRGVQKVPVPQRSADKHLNVAANLRAALRVVDGPFYLFNDDMYALRPMPDGVPMVHRGQWEAWLTGRIDARPSDWYTTHAVHTDALMRHWQVPGVLRSYEVHAPMLMDAERLTDLMARAEEAGATLRDRYSRAARVFLWRSLYGNVHRVGGRKVTDPKVYTDAGLNGRPSGDWLSSNDAKPSSKVIRLLSEWFPERCRYETGGPR